MASHSVTSHPIQVNAPRLTPAMQAGSGTRFTYPGKMEGWVDLVDLIAPRPGIEPATFRSRVRHPTTAPPRQRNVQRDAKCWLASVSSRQAEPIGRLSIVDRWYKIVAGQYSRIKCEIDKRTVDIRWIHDGDTDHEQRSSFTLSLWEVRQTLRTGSDNKWPNFQRFQRQVNAARIYSHIARYMHPADVWRHRDVTRWPTVCKLNQHRSVHVYYLKNMTRYLFRRSYPRFAVPPLCGPWSSCLLLRPR